MLTYTFSTREKVMLGILAIVGIAVLWYQLVFQNVQAQLSTLDAEIASVQDEYTINQARALQLANMRAAVEGYEQQGYEAVLLPSYDNTQNLMAYLNGVLGSTQEYTITFDNPALDEESNTIHRVGVISYVTGSYGEARSIANAIAHGPYACEVNALGITNNTVQPQGTDQTVASNLQVTFFERPSATSAVAEADDEVQGQDLSQLSEWNSQ